MKTNQQHDDFIMLPKNDFAFKLLFGSENNKDLLIDLLAAIFGKDAAQLTELELSTPICWKIPWNINKAS